MNHISKKTSHTRSFNSSIPDDESFNDENSITYYDDGERHIDNPCLRAIVCFLVFFKCMPEKTTDSTPMKNALRGLQWAALLCDLAAAIVTIASFSGNTICCGSPVLDMIGHAPWDIIIPVGSYVYTALVILEIYPVVLKGYLFNLINPALGCCLTIAMFFDDSVMLALITWGLEFLSVIFECVIYVLKVKQKKFRKKEIRRLGRLTKRSRKPLETEEQYEKDIKKIRFQYWQLKQEHANEKKRMWYLALGNAFNLMVVGIVLVLIVFVKRAGGLCIENGVMPNPFDSNQVGRCEECAQDRSESCEVCTADTSMCYYPYS